MTVSAKATTAFDGVATATVRDRGSWVLPAVLRSQAAKRGAAPFLQFEDGVSVSYADVFATVERLAGGLAALGVTKGDRVLLMGANSLEFLYAWFAVNLLGAIEVPVNTAARGLFLQHIIDNSGARVLIGEGKYVPLLLEVAHNIPKLTDLVLYRESPADDLPWNVHSFAECSRTQAPPPMVDVLYRDIGAIMYTSGTTGPAKGVLVTHAHMYLFAKQMVDCLRIVADDTYLVVLPLFHGNAQFVQVYAAMAVGCKAVICERFSATRWLDQVRRSGATISSLLGVTAQFVWNQPPSDRDRDHHLTRMITIPMPAAIGKPFEARFGVRCIDGYGMTEVSVPILNRYDDPLRPGSCGKPCTEWFDVDLVDPETDESVATGEIGEIVVRPKYPWILMAGYHEMPERTLEAWRNLWFHTADAGRRDTDGYYYFLERLKDRIRRRGENVSGYEVEMAACDHPKILEAAAVAVPADEGDDDIKLCVVTSDGQLDYAEFLEFLRRHLPRYALPRYVEVFNQLPKTPTGKVIKVGLREHAKSPTAWDYQRSGNVLR